LRIHFTRFPKYRKIAATDRLNRPQVAGLFARGES
jgi:hypothetical protein